MTTERADVLRELGVRLSDVLSAERILILEGVTDKDVFDVWFPEVTRNPQVVVVDGGGGYNARHAELFAKWLSEADQLGTRRVLYARDADELSAKFLQRLKDSSYVHVLPCRELENLLLDFEAITAILQAQPEGGVRTKKLSVEDVASAARQIADELKPIVVLKRVMADLAEPIRLVDHAMRKRLAKAQAGEDELLAEVLKRVPSAADVEATVADAWQQHSEVIDNAWEDDWARLAPGADVLAGLWQKYLGRGYSKARDGLLIASAMAGPPADLVEVMREFMAEERAKRA